MNTPNPTLTATDLPADLVERMAQVALELACAASATIAGTRAANVRTKASLADPVTDTDMAVETMVRERIATEFGDHRLVGEEYGTLGPDDARFSWYCDPVDGTANYANSLDWSSFSLCCSDSDGGVTGVVADPYRRRIVTATRGQGAVVRPLDDSHRPVPGAERRLAVRPATDLAGTLFTTEWLTNEPWPGMIGLLDRLSRRSCTPRIMGSSALSLLQVGLGASVGCIIGQYHAIDNAASVLIGWEAGAVSCGLDGRLTQHPTEGVLLACPGVLDVILADWRAAVGADRPGQPTG